MCASAAFGMSAYAAGVAVARAFAQHNAHVAVVPMGDAGGGAASALRELLPDTSAIVEGHSPGGTGVEWPQLGSSRPVGEALASYVISAPPSISRIYLDPGSTTWIDAGAGFLAALGATSDADLTTGVAGLGDIASLEVSAPQALLAGRELVLIAPHDQATVALTGLRGLSSVQGRAAGIELAEQIRIDSVLANFARTFPDAVPADSVGTGVAGGLGFAIRSLGGRVVSGFEACAEAASLGRTLTQADLVVVVCDRLDFGSWGDGLVPFLAGMIERHGALAPLIVVSGASYISARELRLHGIDSAFAVGEVSDAASLTQAVAPVASTWLGSSATRPWH